MEPVRIRKDSWHWRIYKLFNRSQREKPKTICEYTSGVVWSIMWLFCILAYIVGLVFATKPVLIITAILASMLIVGVGLMFIVVPIMFWIEKKMDSCRRIEIIDPQEKSLDQP